MSDCHEPIIPEELFFAAQSTLKEYVQKGSQGRKKTHLFSDKIRCGHCGYALIRRKHPTVKYYCSTAYKKKDSPCKAQYIIESQLAEIVYETILQYCKTLLNKGYLAKRKKKGNQIANLSKQISAYQTAFNKYENQKAELYEKRAEGHITKEQYVKKYQELQSEHEDVRCQLEELKDELALLESAMANTLPQEQKLQSYLETDTLTREMVLEFVDCIYVYDKQNIHIKWRFEQEGVNNGSDKKCGNVLQSGSC